jgi:hypothetical protein
MPLKSPAGRILRPSALQRQACTEINVVFPHFRSADVDILPMLATTKLLPHGARFKRIFELSQSKKLLS